MKTVKCPNCGTTVSWNSSSPARPFCSDRCRLIDLGDWASEAHHIEGEAVDFTQLPDAPKNS